MPKAFEHYVRRDLAIQFTRSILSKSPLSPARSGLFYTAPRRTGKSTFVRNELRDELQLQGALVIYVDLWSDKLKDPALHIAQAISEEVSANEGALSKISSLFKGATVSGLGVAVSLAADNANQPTLRDLLIALSDASSKTIVLLIDEAQHALTTTQGENALFALKAARDELNSGEHHGLRLVATGSDSGKLALLTSMKDQAFFGAPMHAFPHLDRHYVEWFCEQASDLDLAVDAVEPLFASAHYRPEVLASAYGQVVTTVISDARSSIERFQHAVSSLLAEEQKTHQVLIDSLQPLQRAVLTHMALAGREFAPYAAHSIAEYEKLASQFSGFEIKIDTSGVQNALNALLEQKLVWRSKRGFYEIEDAAIVEAVKTAKMNVPTT